MSYDPEAVIKEAKMRLHCHLISQDLESSFTIINTLENIYLLLSLQAISVLLITSSVTSVRKPRRPFGESQEIY